MSILGEFVLRLCELNVIPTHISQLVVVHAVFDQPGVKAMMSKCKKLVKFYHKSPAATQKFRKCVLELGLPQLELVRGCKTRWSSYYFMLERLLKVF